MSFNNKFIVLLNKQVSVLKSKQVDTIIKFNKNFKFWKIQIEISIPSNLFSTNSINKLNKSKTIFFETLNNLLK